MEDPAPRTPGGLQVEDLLLNGFWKSSRATSPAPSAFHFHDPQPANLYMNYETANTTKKRLPRTVTKPPPRPICEDERSALARELGTAKLLATLAQDPPFRGSIDQDPVILEASIPGPELPFSSDAINRDHDRRFVMLTPMATPKPEITDSGNEEDEKSAAPEAGASKPNNRGSYRERAEEKHEFDTKQNRPSSPLLDRRRNMRDLPSLKTEMPPVPLFKRSTSAYRYTPSRDDPNKTYATPQTAQPGAGRDPLLGTPTSGKVQTPNYFDSSITSTPREYPRGDTPREKRVSPEASRNRSPSMSSPLTPTSEKRRSFANGSEVPSSAANRYTPEYFRSNSLANEVTTRNAEQKASSLSKPETAANYTRHASRARKTDLRSSDDSSESSDSDQGRKHGPGHQHRHQQRRSRSRNRRPYEPKVLAKSRTSPLPPPQVSPSQTRGSDSHASLRADTFPRAGRSSGAPSALRENSLNTDRLPLERSAAPSLPRRPSPAQEKENRSSTLTLNKPTGSSGRSRGNSFNYTPGTPKVEKSPRSARPPSPNPLKSPEQSWQPPPFYPPENAQKPVGFYRRQSQDIEAGKLPPLPPCPRTALVRGYNDWITLRDCPSFNICPSCYNSTVAQTPFRSAFVTASRYSSHEELLCDFGSTPWYRIAWLLTFKEQHHDLRLLYGIAKVLASTAPCLGKHEAVRQWYSIRDPSTGAIIRNFDVCQSCVRSIEVLLPALRGIWIRVDHGPLEMPRICDMRFDSKRFVHYFDALETTADATTSLSRPAPDLHHLAELAKQYTLVEECQRDTDLFDASWHVMNELPEFTVCEDCWQEVMVPFAARRKPLATLFRKDRVFFPKASCQLYSDKMRGVLGKAMEESDFGKLATKARERKGIERAYKANLMDVGRRWAGDRYQAALEVARLRREWEKWE